MTPAIVEMAAGIAADLQRRLPGQRKTQRDKLALLVATMLDARSANLMVLAASLPRAAERADMRYQWIARFIDNPLVVCDEVMEPFAREVLTKAAEDGRVVLIMDQTKANDRHQILMLSLHFGERALPLAWRVEATEGAIGFAVQKDLLQAVAGWLPSQAEICLMADRFYGTPDLIAFAIARGWGYRLRVRSNLRVAAGGHKTSLAEHVTDKRPYLTDVALTHRRIVTNIGIINAPGHAEPWIIAMSDTPSYLTTLDYSARWGIEPMFSDFKSRGFGLEHSQLRSPERLGRLVLVMSIALYFAVSTGLCDAQTNPSADEKKAPDVNPRT
ncbi:transposase [Nguyenibacter vanlangensis]|uniref:Transposase n=1 Tax=Nguyenibacter vanlangensis TaxID=1216886 RepID=A0A7Y7IZF7_9PROT|nr:transposase [Nguyenibacter vanlangensis]NVN13233.1 transposase [Nguyenibacter vanlangensis]